MENVPILVVYIEALSPSINKNLHVHYYLHEGHPGNNRRRFPPILFFLQY